jgi:hypothetical protein
VHVLRDYGIPTIASDIERQAGFDLHFVGDFLKQDHASNGMPVHCRATTARRFRMKWYEIGKPGG